MPALLCSNFCSTFCCVKGCCLKCDGSTRLQLCSVNQNPQSIALAARLLCFDRKRRLVADRAHTFMGPFEKNNTGRPVDCNAGRMGRRTALAKKVAGG